MAKKLPITKAGAIEPRAKRKKADSATQAGENGATIRVKPDPAQEKRMMQSQLAVFAPDGNAVIRECTLNMGSRFSLMVYDTLFSAIGGHVDMNNNCITIRDGENNPIPGITFKGGPVRANSNNYECTITLTPDVYMQLCAKWEADPRTKLSGSDLGRWPDIKRMTPPFAPSAASVPSPKR
jgi:hypothetical protein